MDRAELEAKVIELIEVAYGKEAGTVTVDSVFGEDLAGASVQMVALTAAIENELDATLMLADASACTTVSELVDLVEEEM